MKPKDRLVKVLRKIWKMSHAIYFVNGVGETAEVNYTKLKNINQYVAKLLKAQEE